MTRAASVALLSFAVCAPIAGTLALAQSAAPERTGGADANRGRLIAVGGLYGEQRIGCVQCHGLDGAGDSSGAFPYLAGQSAWYLYKSLQDYAAGLRPSDVMGPIAASLAERDMRDVAAHYAAARGEPAGPGKGSDPSMQQIGGAIAAAGLPAQGVPACNGCHGADGGGAPPLYPSLAGQYANYTRHQLMLWQNGRRDGDPMNIMELIAKAMTETQIEAVARYYAAVVPSPDTAPPDRSRPGSLPGAAPSRMEKPNIIGLPGVRPLGSGRAPED
jgi:cytochrome c553